MQKHVCLDETEATGGDKLKISKFCEPEEKDNDNDNDDSPKKQFFQRILNAHDKHNYTPLMYAHLLDRREIFEILVKHKALCGIGGVKYHGMCGLLEKWEKVFLREVLGCSGICLRDGSDEKSLNYVGDNGFLLGFGGTSNENVKQKDTGGVAGERRGLCGLCVIL